VGPLYSFKEVIKVGIKEIEERLKEQFQEGLEKYYKWEAQTQEEFQDLVYGPDEEE